MFVGDSMTIGHTGDFTWRYRMWQHLNATFGGPYRIVGPRHALHDTLADAPTSSAYGDPGFPDAARRHLAGWGEGWLHMAPLIGDAVRRHDADTLLVSLGLIDLGFYTNAEQTAGERAASSWREAREAAPHIRAVLMPVIPNVRAAADAAFGAECVRFNELLAKAVADLSTPASPLLLASEPAGWEIAARHVRRDAPLAAGGAPPGGRVRRGDAPGVGGRSAVRGVTRGSAGVREAHGGPVGRSAGRR